MSTRRIRSGSPTSKKLSSCVRPGVFEVARQPLAVGQRVEQRAFADVGAAGERDFRHVRVRQELQARAPTSGSRSAPRTACARARRVVVGLVAHVVDRVRVATGAARTCGTATIAGRSSACCWSSSRAAARPANGAMTNISTHGMIAKICCWAGSIGCGLSLNCSHMRDAEQDRQHADREEARRREVEQPEQVDRGQRVGRGQILDPQRRTAGGAFRR